MLWISLILSALLLFISNRAVRRSRIPGTVVGCASLALVIGPFLMMCILPAVAVQSLLLWLAVLVRRDTGRDPSSFLRHSCGATVLAYGLAGILGIRSEYEYARLRRLFPYESMEARVSAPTARTVGLALSPDIEVRLSAIEGEITRSPNGMRERQLRRLHEDAVGLFINNPGFGVARMFLPAEWNLRMGLRREPVPTQPGPGDLAGVISSPGEWRLPPPGLAASLGRMLDASILDFVNPRGFGYFKDRRHVAGFETHRFGQIPEPATRWTVRRLELVSLLLHDEPVVYISDRLPEMDKMHGTPTRPLDRFERFALDELERGEDLFIAEAGDRLRMLAAVRSVRQCVACHDGSRGDLLGAFSYNLAAEGH